MNWDGALLPKAPSRVHYVVVRAYLQLRLRRRRRPQPIDLPPFERKDEITLLLLLFVFWLLEAAGLILNATIFV